MTTTADDYINRVLEVLPRTMPLRSQIGMELRGHIAERVQAGQSMDDVLRQLGDPVVLAESYLSAEPLTPAPFASRVAAKLLDGLIAMALVSPFAAFCWTIVPRDFRFPAMMMIVLLGGTFTFAIYSLFADYSYGRTLGKRIMGLRVVQESGARITFGQALVRQLPMFLQFYWVDVMFALFTDKHQRAFELLSKTRVVLASPSGRESI